jgi:lysophospholipase L1-like esterase
MTPAETRRIARPCRMARRIAAGASVLLALVPGCGRDAGSPPHRPAPDSGTSSFVLSPQVASTPPVLPAPTPDAVPGSTAPDALLLQAELVVPSAPVTADKRFDLSLRLAFSGDAPLALRPAPDGDAPAARLEISSPTGELLGSLPLPASALAELLPGGQLELTPGGTASMSLPAPRAPMAPGSVSLVADVRLAGVDGRSWNLRTPPATLAVTWQGLTVLHIGDSLVSGGLTHRMGRLVHDAGGRYVTDCWVASNAPKWLGSDRLAQLLRDELPDVVLITLGTNEYQVPAPREYVDWYARLAARLGHRRCFWIGPPQLPGVDAFVEAASQRTAPCPFFDSRAFATPDAGKDRDHLSEKRGEEWAEAIWAWLGRQWRP